MDVYWPGLIIGALLTAVCLLGVVRREALARVFDAAATQTVGEKVASKTTRSIPRTTANLMVPLVGGMVLGAAILVLSVTGVMGPAAEQPEDAEGSAGGLIAVVLALIGLGFGGLALAHFLMARKGNPPSRWVTVGAPTVGMAFLLVAGATLFFAGR